VVGNGIGVGYQGLELQIDALRRRYWVVCWDHRGVFLSDPPGSGGVGVAAHARDCLAIIDELGLVKPRYLGWSMGVQVGIEVWRLRRGTFERLALASGVAGNPLRAAVPLPVLADAAPAVTRGLAPIAAAIRPVLARVVASPGFVAGARLLGLLRPHADTQLFMTMTRGVASHDPSLYLRTLAELCAHEAEEVLPTIDVPVLFLAGRVDRMTPPRELERLAALCPAGRAHVVEGASHFLPIEQPAELERVLDAFFAESLGATLGW
jgi:pimeloyl-ACP methyl ester carboxylesterase